MRLLSDHEWRGSINIANGQAPGLNSDFNIVSDRFTVDDGDTVLTLAEWQTRGHDANSFIATEDDLFRLATGDDYRLRPGSRAIDAGKDLPAVTADISGAPRPWGAGFDVGAYEFVESTQSTVWLPMLTHGS